MFRSSPALRLLIASIAALFLPAQTSAQIIQTPTQLRNEGFVPFPTVRTGYGVGTVLQTRMDGGRLRTVPYFTPDLLRLDPIATILTTEEVVPAIESSDEGSISAALRLVLARFPGASANTSIAQGSTVRIVFGKGLREMLLGADIERSVRAAIARGLPAPGRYSIIIGTISFSELEAKVTNTSSATVKGELDSAVKAANASIIIKSDNGAFILPAKFTQPHRAFYMYQEIRPVAAAVVGAPDVQFELLPGAGTIIQEDD